MQVEGLPPDWLTSLRHLTGKFCQMGPGIRTQPWLTSSVYLHKGTIKFNFYNVINLVGQLLSTKKEMGLSVAGRTI